MSREFRLFLEDMRRSCQIAGFRDVAIHEYFGLDREVVWDIVVKEVPALLDQLKRIIR